MVKIEKVEVFNLLGAIRGMRNPLESWSRSDSTEFVIGPNDLDLMKRLYKAGTDHRKYLRQILVCFDITAPVYFYKQYDTYKISTTANSCSVMHKVMSAPFTEEDFSFDRDYRTLENEIENKDLIELLIASSKESHIKKCNDLRNLYLDEKGPLYKSKSIWRLLVQTLGSSHNQKRTVTLSFENLINMIGSRRNHKLSEWNEFIEQIETKIPELKEIMS
ncbi:MAG: hypothetical protein ACRCW9_06600 [Cetobacterium sp.]